MGNDNSQTLGAVLTNLRNAKILEERAKKHRNKVTGPLIKGSPSAQNFLQATEIEAVANKDLSRALKVDGVDYLALLCEQESGNNLNASFLQKLIASYAVKNDLSKGEIHDMRVVDFVQKLKSKQQATKNTITPKDASKLKEKSLMIPKVFISYSWTTPEHEEWVVNFAEKLVTNGVDVNFDKWNLRLGYDVNYFMEQLSKMDKVLMICDKRYKEKAEKREGGVGIEATIITSEIYGKPNQGKYIPILSEVDGKRKGYIPKFAATNAYIDFSNDKLFDKNFEELLRDIHQKPKYIKPLLGKPPEFLDINSYSKVKTVVKTIKQDSALNQQSIFESSFEKHYQMFKENMINIFCVASQTQCSSENTKELTNLQKFRDFFKEDTGDGQDRWHRVLNGLNDYYLKQILDNMEILRKEVELALCKIDKYTPKQLSMLKELSSSLYRLRDVTIDYDDTKRLSIFLWSLFTGWDIIYGYISEEDQYENIFSKKDNYSQENNQRVKNDKDKSIIKIIFTNITSLSALDKFINEAMVPYLVVDVLDEFSDFKKFFHSTKYHIYDNELADLLEAFSKSWADTCSYWEAFTPTNNPEIVRPATEMDIALDEDVAKAIKEVPKVAKKMHSSLKKLVSYIKEKYIDLEI